MRKNEKVSEQNSLDIFFFYTKVRIEKHDNSCGIVTGIG